MSEGFQEPEELTEGGDPVCWLDRVCDACGAMREDMRAARCARCGAPFHGAPEEPAVDDAPDGTRRPSAG